MPSSSTEAPSSHNDIDSTRYNGSQSAGPLAGNLQDIATVHPSSTQIESHPKGDADVEESRLLASAPTFDVYVGPPEQDGFPAPEEQTNFAQVASRLVRAHTRRPLRYSHTRRTIPGRSSIAQPNARTDGRTYDDTHFGTSGVLSTLLSLYDPGDDRDDSDDSTVEEPPLAPIRSRPPAYSRLPTRDTLQRRNAGHSRSSSAANNMEVNLTIRSDSGNYPVSGMQTPPVPEVDLDLVDAKGSEGRFKEPLLMDEKKRRRKTMKKKMNEIFITRHVAQILHRQDFILKLTRALMMFGAPSHRLETQIQTTARILDVQLSCLHLPGVMILCFGDIATSTCDVRILKQGSALDLGKLLDAHMLYWNVIHDKLSVSDASSDLDVLMRKPLLYNLWQSVVIGGLCASAIAPVTFNASLIDTAASFPLGAMLVLVQQMSSKNDLYSSVFEITIATLISFVAAGLAATGKFCYTAVASSSIVLILPGYMFLSGSLEFASRNIISGAIRTCYAIIYCLFLGFGLSIGAEIFHRASGQPVLGAGDFSCAVGHSESEWWRRSPSLLVALLCVPAYSFLLGLRYQALLRTKELYVTIVISSVGWTVSRLSELGFTNRRDISSALGSFVLGIAGNLYGRFYSGGAFVVMIIGILFQLPSGMGTSNLLMVKTDDSNSFFQGFIFAQQLLSVAIGLTVGLFFAAVVVYPFGRGRRGATGLFSL